MLHLAPFGLTSLNILTAHLIVIPLYIAFTIIPCLQEVKNMNRKKGKKRLKREKRRIEQRKERKD